MFDLLEKSRDILGINARILTYMRPSNSLGAIRIADNKLLSKKILEKNGLPVLQTYSTIKGIQELKTFNWTSLPSTFTLKPNRGLGGEGIMILFGRKKNILMLGLKLIKN